MRKIKCYTFSSSELLSNIMFFDMHKHFEYRVTDVDEDNDDDDDDMQMHTDYLTTQTQCSRCCHSFR